MRNFDSVAGGYLPDGLVRIGLDLDAVDGEYNATHRETPLTDPEFGARPTSVGKNLMTEVMELGAACPSPQMEASRIATDNSDNRSLFQPRAAISLTAFSVPARQGVH